MSEAGAVIWQFEKKGVIAIEVGDEAAEELALAAIDAGADDFETEASILNIYCAYGTLEGIRKTLVEQGAAVKSSEFSMVPKNTVSLDEKSAMRTLRLLDQLEDLDDVQRVFSNADFPDSTLDRYQSEG